MDSPFTACPFITSKSIMKAGERIGKVTDSILLCSGTVQVETEGRLGFHVCKLEEKTHPASHGLEQEAPFRGVQYKVVLRPSP